MRDMELGHFSIFVKCPSSIWPFLKFVLGQELGHFNQLARTEWYQKAPDDPILRQESTNCC